MPQGTICNTSDFDTCDATFLGCFADYADYVCNNPGIAHVFYTETVPCGNPGQFWNMACGADSTGFVTVDEGNASSSTTLTSILAHELGHGFGRGHCDDEGTTQAQWCSDSDCAAGTQNDNLMCQNLSGRQLASGQCTAAHTELPDVWDDLN